MLHVAENSIALRQNLATGRVSERVTDLPLEVLAGKLWAEPDGGLRIPIAAQFQQRAGGYFSFSLSPDRDMPDLSGAPQVKLRAEFTVRGHPMLVRERSEAGAQLSIDASTRLVAGRQVDVSIVRGAPFDLSVSVDPQPVGLAGIVIDHDDPEKSLGGVTVTARAVTGPPGPALSTVAGTDGRFFFAALPLVLVVELEVSKDGITVRRKVPVDYGRPVNTATLSWPG